MIVNEDSKQSYTELSDSNHSAARQTGAIYIFTLIYYVLLDR